MCEAHSSPSGVLKDVHRIGLPAVSSKGRGGLRRGFQPCTVSSATAHARPHSGQRAGIRWELAATAKYARGAGRSWGVRTWERRRTRTCVMCSRRYRSRQRAVTAPLHAAARRPRAPDRDNPRAPASRLRRANAPPSVLHPRRRTESRGAGMRARPTRRHRCR